MMTRLAPFFTFVLFILTSLSNPATAAVPVPIDSVFNARAFNCTTQDDSLLFNLYMVTYDEQMQKSIQKVGENQIKLGNTILSGVTSFVNTPKKVKYDSQMIHESSSLNFSVATEGVKIVRLAFVKGYDWAGYSFDIDGPDDQVQNFLDKHGLNKAEHPIEDIFTTREGFWRITCNVSGA